MMTTGPLPSLIPAIPTPGGAARKSASPADQDGQSSSFADFLPDHGSQGAATPANDTDAEAADAVKMKLARTAENDANDATEAAASALALPPGPTMMLPITTMSVQQATLTATPNANVDADRAKEEAIAASPTAATPPRDSRFGRALIRPLEPLSTGATVSPTSGAPVAAPVDPTTGGVKTIPSPITPHGPPLDQQFPLWNDSRQMTTAATTTAIVADDTKTHPPQIEPHGPPDLPVDTLPASPTPIVDTAAPAVAFADPVKKPAPSPIEPHGPPDLPDDTLTVATLSSANATKPIVPSPIAPHGPPDQSDVTTDSAAVPVPNPPDLTVNTATVNAPLLPGATVKPTTAAATSLPGTTVKTAALVPDPVTAVPVNPVKQPPIPSGGPEMPDMSIKAASATVVDRSKKAIVSPIAPHGPPVTEDDPLTTTAVSGGDISQKATNFPLIEPHGPPTIPDDTLGVVPDGVGKVELTTTFAGWVGAPGNPVPTTINPLPSLAKGEYTTAIPGFADETQKAMATLPASTEAPPIASGDSFWAGAVEVPKPVNTPTLPIEITSAAQAWMSVADPTTPHIAPVKADAPPASEGEDAGGTESAPITALRPAILAARPFVEAGRTTDSTSYFVTQVTQQQKLMNDQNAGGTPVANQQAIVTVEATSTEVNIERSPLLRRAGAGLPVSALGGRATASGAEKAPAIPPTAAVDPTADVRADTLAAVPTTPPAQNADHVQKLLQTVLDAGIKTGANGASQLEMRVRLDGGTNDVTVRLQMQDSRMHVTFQTGSPELRQALERGWSDFTAQAAQTSPVIVEPPRFVADAAARTQSSTDFSGGQQNPSRQDTQRNTEEAAPMTGSSWRGSRIVSSTATQPTPTASGSSDRWTGWA